MNSDHNRMQRIVASLFQSTFWFLSQQSLYEVLGPFIAFHCLFSLQDSGAPQGGSSGVKVTNEERQKKGGLFKFCSIL